MPLIGLIPHFLPITALSTNKGFICFPWNFTPAGGPWARYVHDPDARSVGVVRYLRLVPRDEHAAVELSKRTLTNLYNQRSIWHTIG